MRRRSFISLVILPVAGSVGALWAQEGHPLTGSWHGQWSPTSGKKVPIFIFMKWNSTAIEGTINPGPKGVPIQVANLHADNWTVHLEAESKDHKHIVIDGKLDKIGSYHRTITGTWTEGDMKGDFDLTRD